MNVCLKVCLHVTFFSRVSVIITLIKCVHFIAIRITQREMGPSTCPTLSVILTATIGTMLNFNGGNNGHMLKIVTCKQTLMCTILYPVPLL